MTENDVLDRYVHPLTDRYASREMVRVFSPRYRFETWRRLWVALAEAEREMGLPVSEEAIQEMRAGLESLDLEGTPITTGPKVMAAVIVTVSCVLMTTYSAPS